MSDLQWALVALAALCAVAAGVFAVVRLTDRHIAAYNATHAKLQAQLVEHGLADPFDAPSGTLMDLRAALNTAGGDPATLVHGAGTTMFRALAARLPANGDGTLDFCGARIVPVHGVRVTGFARTGSDEAAQIWAGFVRACEIAGKLTAASERYLEANLTNVRSGGTVPGELLLLAARDHRMRMPAPR